MLTFPQQSVNIGLVPTEKLTFDQEMLNILSTGLSTVNSGSETATSAYSSEDINGKKLCYFAVDFDMAVNEQTKSTVGGCRLQADRFLFVSKYAFMIYNFSVNNVISGRSTNA